MLQRTSILLFLLSMTCIAFAQPSNDDFANAINITTLPFSNTVLSTDGMNATIETDETVCQNDESWWYSFTPTISTYYLITSEVSGVTSNNDNNDVRLGIYTGTAHPLVEENCFDSDNGSGWGEEEFIQLTSGTTYYIRIAPSDATKILDVTTSVRAVNAWTGAIDGDWANSGNWTLGNIPTTDEVALLLYSANEVTILNGTSAVANQVILAGADLTIESSAILDITDSGRDGIFVDEVGSVLTINGTVNLSNIPAYGIHVDDGVLNISSTATVNISDSYVGMEFSSDSTHTIDGDINISDCTAAILLLDEESDTILFSASSTITIENIAQDGIYIDGTAPFINIAGTINMDTIGIGFYIEEGTINIDGTVDMNYISFVGTYTRSTNGILNLSSSGILNISEVTYLGMEDVIGTNAGTITITNTGLDAINTGYSTFTNTGSIFISNAGSDGIDADADFNNSGIVQIENVTSFVLNDATFNNLSGGTLRVDGTADGLNSVFNAGSIIEPGVTIGCLLINSTADLSNTIINIDVDNTTFCSEHDKIFITGGDLTITDAQLNLSGNYTPVIGDEITILEVVTSSNPITGTFLNLNEGDNITFNNADWTISYMGGNGNDVTLTVTALLSAKLQAKLFLSGPYDTNTGLMNDDLRTNSLIPTTEPYSAMGFTFVLNASGTTIASSVLEVTGDDAIVDWILVELRDQSDSSVVIETYPALLQKDGDVVDIDGISSIEFTSLADDYFIAFHHRNHLALLSESAITLGSDAVVVDFTTTPSLAKGGTTAFYDFSNGVYGCINGDYNGDGQVQNADISTLRPFIGTSGYDAGDLDMNGQIQNSDIQTFLIPMLGKGEQF